MWTYGTDGPMAPRIGFAIDVVGYSGRPHVAKVDAQQRTLAMVEGMIAATGVDSVDTDRQPNGDGMVVFLPASVEPRRALAALTRTAGDWLVVDNQRYVDRLRLRLAVVVGPVGPAPLGFAGNTVIECARLLDSQVLREAMAHASDVDLAVLVSDRLYSDVVREGYPGYDPSEFRRVLAQAKDYEAPAWLWLGSGGGGRASTVDNLALDLARLRVVTAVDHERLFGVDDELARLASYLSNRSGDPVISIWGPPGVGKTALAYELVLRHAQPAGFRRVAAVSAKFSRLEAGGTLGLDRARLAIDWRDVLVDIGRQLNLPADLNPASIEEQLPAALPDEPCLLLIDNLETLPQAELAVDFLTRGQTLVPHKVVLTTRTSVAGRGSRGIRERHWTGPDREAALDYARYLAGDDPTLDPRPTDLVDVVDAAERTPLLIRLIIQQAIFQRLPMRDVIAGLRQRVGDLGSAVWQYLYADSLDALAAHVGFEIAVQLMSVFCAKPSGSSFDREELHELSEIDDRELFDRAVAAACRLTLVRPFAGNTQFTVHSLLREFSCDDVARRPD